MTKIIISRYKCSIDGCGKGSHRGRLCFEHFQNMPEGFKPCTGECGLTLPLTDYHFNKRTFDGRSFRCKKCSCAARKRDRDTNPEKFRQRNRDYRAADPQKVAAYHRDKNLQRDYGITAAEWDQMFEAQGRCCAICKQQTVRDRLGRGWHVDHDHATGQVRGILCLNCNLGIGYMRDDPTILENAKTYLEKFHASAACGSTQETLASQSVN